MNSETDALKELYSTVIDSWDGYEKASEVVDSPRLQSLFEELQDRRARHAAELREYLASTDIDLDDDGTILASVHRQYLGLKDMVSDDDAAVVAEVIRGERQLLDAYDQAIRSMDATSPAFSFATEQHRNLEAHIEELELFAEDNDSPSTRKEIS